MFGHRVIPNAITAVVVSGIFTACDDPVAPAGQVVGERSFASGDAGSDARPTVDEIELPPDSLPAGCVDADGDRWPVCSGATAFSQDCDDSDRAVFPHAGPACDGSDRNCNGLADTEEPGGCTPAQPGNARQDPLPPELEIERPPAPPWPEGCADDDGDHWPACDDETAFSQDCDDDDPAAFPHAGPACDGSDRNCNGIADTVEPNGCHPAVPGNARPAPDAGP